ncbi:thioredoxin family protein [Syntrophomonas erecta]
MKNKKTVLTIAILGLFIIGGGLLWINRNQGSGEYADNDSMTGPDAATLIKEAQENSQPMWVIFRTASCPACVEMKKVFDELRPDYEGKIEFIDVNLDDMQNHRLGRDYHIGMVPQIYVYNQAGEIVYEQVGYVEKQEMINQLNKALEE